MSKRHFLGLERWLKDLRALAAHPEDLGSICSIYVAAHNFGNSSSGLCGRHGHGAQLYMQAKQSHT